MKKNILLSILIIIFLASCSSSETTKEELTISAAASLTDSLFKLNEMFEDEHAPIQTFTNYGGSGSLRKQIEQGAPIDIFLSASSKDYEMLVEQGIVHQGKAFLTNSLVLITQKENNLESFESYTIGEGLIAIGTPETVPAGSYSKEALNNLGEWKKLESENRIIFTKDVTQVLTLVQEGAAEVGIVYSSDVLHNENVKVIYEFDSTLHEPIYYYIALLERGDDSELIMLQELYYDYILSDKAMEVFKEQGFHVIE